MKRILAVLLFILPALAAAQNLDFQLPISLDADSTDYDGKNSMMMFRGLRLSQGQIGVAADQGRASKLDFQDSVWRFEGNVVIDVENGHIECDAADLRFIGHTLRVASIEGSPATFEMTRPGSEEATYAEAGKLEYDLDAGVIEFSENAVITEGGNRISSSYLVYNIKEQRINAQSADDDEKVKIIYTPIDESGETSAESTAAEAAEEDGDASTEDRAEVSETP